MQVVEHLEHTDMCCTARAAARKYQSNARPRNTRLLRPLFGGALLGECGV
jgi:hypothetical protein